MCVLYQQSLLTAEQHSVMWLRHRLIILSLLMDIGVFSIFSSRNKGVVADICINVFMDIFISSGLIPKGRFAELLSRKLLS